MDDKLAFDLSELSEVIWLCRHRQIIVPTRSLKIELISRLLSGIYYLHDSKVVAISDKFDCWEWSSGPVYFQSC